MKTATYVKTLGGWCGNARLYRLSEPMDAGRGGSTDHVVVSAVVVPYSGPETYIFPCDSDGEVTSFGELDGSYRGGLSHDQALRGAGYTPQTTEEK